VKKILLLLSFLISFGGFAQEKASNQKQLLSQYIGQWASADNIIDHHIGKAPNIKMTVTPKMDDGSLQVEVFQRQDSTYKLILVEMISYDAVTNQMIALGQNPEGKCFLGKGFFTSKNKWMMEDRNFKNELTAKVTFDFISATEVILVGEVPNTNGWKVKYIKIN
jgi:hypothetical protein